MSCDCQNEQVVQFPPTVFAQNSFTTISTTSGTSLVADSPTDTLTVTAGTGITVTGDSATDTVTIANTSLSSASGWQDDGTVVRLVTTTDEVVIGNTAALSSAKVTIDGDTDQIQFIIQGNGTQTADILVIENSATTDLLNFSNSGNMTFASAGEARFRAPTNRIYSRAADTLTVEGNSLTEIGKVGDIILGDSTLRKMYAQTTRKIDLGQASNLFNDLRLGGICHFGASDTGQPMYRMGSGAAPTSPTDGDGWYDSTQKTVVQFINTGIKTYQPGVLYVSTASATVTNTTSETTIIGSGVGTLTLPASFFFAGKTLVIEAWGVYSTEVVPITLQLKIKKGATVLCQTAATTTAGSMANREWHIHATLTGRTTTTVFSQGWFEHMATATAAGSPTIWEMSSTATVTIGTTSEAMDLTATWGAGADAADTITCTNFTMRVEA